MHPRYVAVEDKHGHVSLSKNDIVITTGHVCSYLETLDHFIFVSSYLSLYNKEALQHNLPSKLLHKEWIPCIQSIKKSKRKVQPHQMINLPIVQTRIGNKQFNRLFSLILVLRFDPSTHIILQFCPWNYPIEIFIILKHLELAHHNI